MTTHVYVHGGVSSRAGTTAPSLSHVLDEMQPATTALDAVELAVRALEDDGRLNAGWGSVLTSAGRIELDASIADGTGGFAGVVGVAVRHPITLARRVLEQTPHVLMAGDGAMAVGRDLERLDDTTPEQWERWRRSLAADARRGGPGQGDTVGAVALDAEGLLAAGSSTGGVFGKLPGRVGDSPIFGAGTYVCPGAAVVGTGIGELFLETLAALRCGDLIEAGEHPQRACERVVSGLGNRSDGAAGLLALDARGRVGAAYRGESLAVEGPSGPLHAVRLG
jgi:isoaspartyl peptidase/L-asparaginase-like protein (Ntn-hydrolase superfamily)